MRNAERGISEVVYSHLFEHPTLDMLLGEETVVLDPSTGERLEPTPPAISLDELNFATRAMKFQIWGEAMSCTTKPYKRPDFLTSVA